MIFFHSPARTHHDFEIPTIATITHPSESEKNDIKM